MSDTAEPRYVPPGSCTWCGHPPHGETCGKPIRTGRGQQEPCPCSRERKARPW